MSQPFGRVEHALSAVETRIDLTGENIHTTGTSESAVTTASGYGDIRGSDEIFIAEAVVGAKLGVRPCTQRNTRVSFYTPGRRVNKPMIAYFISSVRVTTVVASITTVLRHTADPTCGCKIVRSAFYGCAERKTWNQIILTPLSNNHNLNGFNYKVWNVGFAYWPNIELNVIQLGSLDRPVVGIIRWSELKSMK